MLYYDLILLLKEEKKNLLNSTLSESEILTDLK